MDNIQKMISEIEINIKDKGISLSFLNDLKMNEEEYEYIMEYLNSENIVIFDDKIEEEIQYEIDIRSYDNVSTSFKQYLIDIGKIPLLTSEEEKRLFKEYKTTGDIAIRNKILNANLRLVVYVVKNYIPAINDCCNSFQDLVQNGNSGLIKAIEKYDINKNFKFSTYAFWWIKQTIAREMENTCKIIRVPVHASEELRNIKLYAENEYKRTGKTPELKDIAQHFNVTEQRIRNLFSNADYTHISIDAKIESDDDSTLQEFISSNDTSVEKIVVDKLFEVKLIELMRKILKPKEFYVISFRFGFKTAINKEGKIDTLEAIGKRLNVSRERVRQLESRSLKRIRIILKNQGIDVPEKSENNKKYYKK